LYIVYFIMCAVKNVCGLVGLWGEEDDAEQRVPDLAAAAAASAAGIKSGRGGKQKPQKWRDNATNFDKHTCRLLFTMFST